MARRELLEGGVCILLGKEDRLHLAAVLLEEETARRVSRHLVSEWVGGWVGG